MQSEVEVAARKLRAALKECEAQRDQAREQLASMEQAAHTSHLMSQASTDVVQSEALRAEKEAADREAALAATVAMHAARVLSLQTTLATVEARAAAREDTLRAEVVALERKCQDAEAARDELAASTTDATLPLMRELEAVTAAAARAGDAAADTEARLLARVQARRAPLRAAAVMCTADPRGAQAAETALLAAETAERGARARATAAETSSRDAAGRAAALTEQLAALGARLDGAQAHSDDLARRLQETTTVRGPAAAAVCACVELTRDVCAGAPGRACHAGRRRSTHTNTASGQGAAFQDACRRTKGVWPRRAPMAAPHGL